VYAFLLRRLLMMIPVAIGVSVLAFLFQELSPGDALDAMIPPDVAVADADLEYWRSRLGLDQPAPIRYLHWMGRVLQGDLGYSLTSHQSVGRMILNRLGPTALLMAFALLLSTVLGIATGVVSAVRQYSWLDYLLTVSAFFWLSVPGFFMGMLLIYIFAVWLAWVPPFGYSSPGAANVWLDRLHHLLLPGISLGLELTAALTRYVRSSLLEVLGADYIRTARAKGLSDVVSVLKHGLPNALIPVISVIGLRLPALFGGSVVIETVFQWPGMGNMLVNAARSRDYPVVMGVTLFVSVMVVISTLLTDIAYAVADPRIRYH